MKPHIINNNEALKLKWQKGEQPEACRGSKWSEVQNKKAFSRNEEMFVWASICVGVDVNLWKCMRMEVEMACKEASLGWCTQRLQNGSQMEAAN